MKIKNVKIVACKLIKLQLIKSKIYKQTPHLLKNSLFKNLERIEIQLKKSIQIINNYHINNKKIFFVGVPYNIQKKYAKASKKTNHLFIPKCMWLNGLLSNKVSIFKHIQKRINKNVNNNLKTLFLVKQKPSLIILLNEKSELIALKEAIKFRVPVIAVVNEKLSVNSDVSYNIYCKVCSLSSKPILKLFYFLLNSLFKKYK